AAGGFDHAGAGRAGRPGHFRQRHLPQATPTNQRRTGPGPPGGAVPPARRRPGGPGGADRPGAAPQSGYRVDHDVAMSTTRNGGHATVQALVDCRVEVVFGIPGSHVIEIYDGLAGTPAVRTVV